jgi:hypothetical protein
MATGSVAAVELSADYWDQTRRPLVCLVFLAPLLVFYEAGVLWLGGGRPDAIRNGADFWMRGGLEQLGLGHPLLLPALVVAGLLVWHKAGKYPWRVPPDTLAGMAAESLLFAFFLVVIGQTTDFVFQSLGGPVALSVDSPAAQAITYLGAGIYEEVMFRLCLLPACYGLFRLSGLAVRSAATLAALATGLAFSLAHYVGPAAEELQLFSFTFRALAGVFFAALFFLRGFGITVGCHAAYDVLVGILLAARET